EEIAKKIADKICGLRVFEDENGKMNINPADAGASLLIVSQFTLYADCKSRRPGFSNAARPETAIPLYELVIAECRARGFSVETGEFGADMKVASVNDGPVTILLDSEEL
nr:D-tyrosyl-tRNA(Tyr) deacylase [Lachnospiraceae bacterium]